KTFAPGGGTTGELAFLRPDHAFYLWSVGLVNGLAQSAATGACSPAGRTEYLARSHHHLFNHRPWRHVAAGVGTGGVAARFNAAVVVVTGRCAVSGWRAQFS